jgi:hypothetical protein
MFDVLNMSNKEYQIRLLDILDRQEIINKRKLILVKDQKRLLGKSNKNQNDKPHMKIIPAEYDD